MENEKPKKQGSEADKKKEEADEAKLLEEQAKLYAAREAINLQKISQNSSLYSAKNLPKIIFAEFDESQRALLILMQYIEGDTLDKIIETRKKSNLQFKEDEIRHILFGILNGLSTLRDNDIVHRDISARNIIIEKKNEPAILY